MSGPIASAPRPDHASQHEKSNLSTFPGTVHPLPTKLTYWYILQQQSDEQNGHHFQQEPSYIQPLNLQQHMNLYFMNSTLYLREHLCHYHHHALERHLSFPLNA